jgi:hypothetical protein
MRNPPTFAALRRLPATWTIPAVLVAALGLIPTEFSSGFAGGDPLVYLLDAQCYLVLALVAPAVVYSLDDERPVRPFIQWSVELYVYLVMGLILTSWITFGSDLTLAIGHTGVLAMLGFLVIVAVDICTTPLSSGPRP